MSNTKAAGARRRYRSIGTAPASGYGRRALIEDRDRGTTISVYFRLGRWRNYRNDDPVGQPLAGIARRTLGAR